MAWKLTTEQKRGEKGEKRKIFCLHWGFVGLRHGKREKFVVGEKVKRNAGKGKEIHMRSLD